MIIFLYSFPIFSIVQLNDHSEKYPQSQQCMHISKADSSVFLPMYILSLVSRYCSRGILSALITTLSSCSLIFILFFFFLERIVLNLFQRPTLFFFIAFSFFLDFILITKIHADKAYITHSTKVLEKTEHLCVRYSEVAVVHLS